MKKYFTILFLFVFSLVSFSQNWNVFNKNYRYNYKFDNSALISQVLFVTSTVQAGTDTIYNMNLIGAPCQSGCPTITTNVGGTVITVPNYQIIIPGSPQFLQRKIKKYSNGLVMLIDTAKLVIKPNCVLNQSWLFDSVAVINATCVAIGTRTIFGINDSVKTIIIGSNDTLILSKSFGIYQFPKPYNLNKYYKLVGIESKSTYTINPLYGLKVPNFWDIYDYNIGDKIYKSATGCIWGGGNTPYTSNTQEIYTVLSKSTNQNSIIYQVTGYLKNANLSCGAWMFPVNAGQISLITFNDTYELGNELYPSAVFAQNTVMTNSLSVILGGDETYNICKFIYDVNGNFTKQGGTSGCKINQPYPGFLQTDSFPSLRRVVIGGIDYLTPYYSQISYGNQRSIYTKGVGLVYKKDEGFEHDFYSCILSVVKGNDTLYGPMPSDGEFVGIKENTFNKGNGLFYPNPSSQKLKFNLSEEFNLEIYDVSGKKVISGQIKETEEINFGDLPEGIYLVRLKNENASYKEKLIISR